MPENYINNNENIFLIITKDKNLFNPSSPIAGFVADISSSVYQLHIIYIGSKKRESKKINDNTFLYTAPNSLFFNFMSVSRIIKSELLWKRRFLPTVVVSIGDEIKITKRVAKRHNRPLFVFYSYINILGGNTINLKNMMEAYPKRIFVPNSYIGKTIENNHKYDPTNTEIVIFPQYLNISNLENIFQSKSFAEDVIRNNDIFSMIVFPRKINFEFYSMIKKIAKEISSSILRFQFFVIVGKEKILWAKILRFIFKTPFEIFEQKPDSVDLFYRSRVMLYFDDLKIPYDPILYSFIAGCPIISSGDEYSKIILFNSDLAEFSHVDKDPQKIGWAIKKLINDPYTYTKYKANCVGFTKSAFIHDRTDYISRLRDGLNSQKINPSS